MNTVGQILIFSIQKAITAIVFATIIISPRVLLAQWQETFTDGELHSDPAWLGDVGAFVVENGELRLKAPEAGSAALATQHPDPYGIWEFDLRLDFNPSGTNLARVYLTSDQADLTGPLQGYYVQIGGSADEIALYRQTDGTRRKIIDGIDGRVDRNPVAITIRVIRSPDGKWQLFSRLNEEGTFFEEGEVTDNNITTSSWFGVQCVFTTTRRDLFYFDNFSFDPGIIADNVPPAIISVEASSSNVVLVTFSESIPEDILSDARLYFLKNESLHPAKVETRTGNSSAALFFEHDFQSNVSYHLAIGPVRDAAGNESPIFEREFIWIEVARAAWKDVVITEVFADPEPSVGLPSEEFIEIFNRSSSALSIDNWTLSDLTSTATIPNAVILPGEYLILTPLAAVDSYRSFGKAMGVSRFPSLNNAGDGLTLKDDRGALIDSVYYRDSWYRDNEKKSGGWSLEIIDPNNLCAEGENWSASESDTGGTPGIINSIYAEKPDLTGPRLLYASAISPTMIKLSFNEKLEDQVPASSSIEIVPETRVEYIELSADLAELDIRLKDPIASGREYIVRVQNVYDCAGNHVVDGLTGVAFALPEPADVNDVVINEILFNPRPGGVDFVEVANRSEKYLNIGDWKIGRLVDGECTDLKAISSRPYSLKPDSIVAFTPNPSNIRNEYPGAGMLWEATLPSYNDNSGAVCITDPDGTIIDSFSYHAQMHSPFIRDKEGVSLERLSTEVASDDPENWKSAASVAGFATPGLPNSNRIVLNRGDSRIRVEPEVFIPVNGAPNFAAIHYAFDNPNQMANIRIYGSSGRQIKTLAQNALVGSNGFLRWEGDCDDGSRARVGSYLIRFELFDQSGLNEVVLKRVVIAGRF